MIHILNTFFLHFDSRKITYKITSSIIALITPLTFHAQASVGMKAPELNLEGTYNCGNKTLHLEALKGQIVVLDFWATWCSPCVAAFPENNRLYHKYKDKNVTFIAITDDPKEKLETFMKKVKIDFCVGRDDDQQEISNYAAMSRPTVVIINREGRIVYRANELEEEKLQEVILTNGIAPEKYIQPEVIVNGGFRGGEDPLFNGMKQMIGAKQLCQSEPIDQLIIRPSLDTKQSGTSAYRMTKEHVGMTYCGGSLSDIYTFLYDLQSKIWIENRVNDSCRYDLIYWRKNDSFEKAIAEINASISRGLSISFDSISSERNVTVLSLAKSNEFIRTEENIEDGTEKAYSPITVFLNRLEELSGKFHIADNSLQGMMIDNQGMEWKRLHEASVDEITAFLKNRGISMTQENRVITSYVINKK